MLDYFICRKHINSSSDEPSVFAMSYNPETGVKVATINGKKVRIIGTDGYSKNIRSKKGSKNTQNSRTGSETTIIGKKVRDFAYLSFV